MGSHGLFLLAVELKKRHARLHALEGLVEEANLLARGHEHQRLALEVRFDEGEQHLDLLGQVAQHVPLGLHTGEWGPNHSHPRTIVLGVEKSSALRTFTNTGLFWIPFAN